VFFKAAADLGLEGIVSKRAASRYRSGPSRSWLKTTDRSLARSSQNSMSMIAGIKGRPVGEPGGALGLAPGRVSGAVPMAMISSGDHSAGTACRQSASTCGCAKSPQFLGRPRPRAEPSGRARGPGAAPDTLLGLPSGSQELGKDLSGGYGNRQPIVDGTLPWMCRQVARGVTGSAGVPVP
jgi:hypothetical protein